MVAFDMLENILIVALIIVCLIVLGNIFTYLLQGWFIFLPKKLAADFHFKFKVKPQELLLDAPSQGKINALWFTENGAPSSKGVVLYMHGNKGCLHRWGHLHWLFRQHGYDFFAYDYRGYGKSTGPRNEAIFYSDGAAMIDFLQQHYPDDKIIIYGRSLGSAIAAKLAMSHPCRQLILETPFTSLPDLFYTYYPLLPRLFRFKYRFPVIDFIENVKAPITIFHGTNDWIVPYKNALRLMRLLREKDTFVTIKGGSHNNLFFYDAYHQKMAELLSQ